MKKSFFAGKCLTSLFCSATRSKAFKMPLVASQAILRVNSYVVIWYIVLFRQEYTDRPTANQWSNDLFTVHSSLQTVSCNLTTLMLHTPLYRLLVFLSRVCQKVILSCSLALCQGHETCSQKHSLASSQHLHRFISEN